MVLNDTNDEYTKGRGAQYNPANKFASQSYIRDFAEGIDDWEVNTPKTTYLQETSKGIAN